MTKQAQSKATTESSSSLARLTNWFNQPNREVDIVILVLLAVLTLVVFANVLDGEFVYDDTRQILQNPVVRDNNQFWTAFTTDVWAFKSGGTEAVSDYWRPFFVLWLVLNERLFGLENTAGWHLANVLLHYCTAVLAYILLRRLKFSRPITTAITLVFLIHPVHVETVSWISGSPDLLLAIPILGAFLLLLNYQKSGDKKQYAAALLLFALALLAKEAAILFPVLIFLHALLWSTEKSKINRSNLLKAGRLTLPFFLIALLYLAARILVLGYIATTRPWQQPLTNILLTIPSIIAFYFRQSIFPLQIGPSYSLRIIDPAGITFQNFWLPLVIVCLTLALLIWIIRRASVKQFGLALFFLFLLPAFNVNAFHPEQIVQDRYLYLPLLGFLIIVIPSLNAALQGIMSRLSWQDWQLLQVSILTLLFTGVLSIPLTVQTIRYNTAWKSDLALWQWGVQTDPTSMLNTYLYGYNLFRNGRPEEAEEAMNIVIANQPLTGPYYTYLQAVEAHLERADIAAGQNRTEQARQDLQTVISLSPSNISPEERENLNAQQQRAIERLALSFVKEKDYETAVEILGNGRQQLPQLACTFTTNMAVSLYLSGKKEEALHELEDVRDRVDLEYTPLCKMSLFYLGQLYLEYGRPIDAQNSLTAFLAASEPFFDSQTANLQSQARELLNQITSQ